MSSDSLQAYAKSPTVPSLVFYMKTAFKIRHPQPDLRYKGRIKGAEIDCGLSPEGQEVQMPAIIRYLKKEIGNQLRESVVYTSTMRRTDIVGEELAKHGCHHKPDSRLKDIRVGPWKEKLEKDIEKEESEQYRRIREDGENLIINGGEAISSVKERSVDAFKDFIAQRCRFLIMIGHNVPLEAIWKTVVEPGAKWNFFSREVGSIDRLLIGDDGHIEVVEKNLIVY